VVHALLSRKRAAQGASETFGRHRQQTGPDLAHRNEVCVTRQPIIHSKRRRSVEHTLEPSEKESWGPMALRKSAAELKKNGTALARNAIELKHLAASMVKRAEDLQRRSEMLLRRAEQMKERRKR